MGARLRRGVVAAADVVAVDEARATLVLPVLAVVLGRVGEGGSER
jgi:hypothetical protein